MLNKPLPIAASQVRFLLSGVVVAVALGLWILYIYIYIYIYMYVCIFSKKNKIGDQHLLKSAANRTWSALRAFHLRAW